MGTENENIVTAELTLRITDDPAFEVVSSRNVDVAQIVRQDVGRYFIALTVGIPVGSLHVTRHGRTVGKGPGTEEPRHTFVVYQVGEIPEGEFEFDLWCYDLSTPPVPVEDDELIQIVWHASPEVPAVTVALEPPILPP